MNSCINDTETEYDGVALLDAFKRVVIRLFSKSSSRSLPMGWKGGDRKANYHGLSGTSLKNFSNDPARSLPLDRALVLLNNLSDLGDHSLHKITFNTALYKIVRRANISTATGSMRIESKSGIEVLKTIDFAIRNKDLPKSRRAYRELEAILAKLESEIVVQEIMLKKENT